MRLIVAFAGIGVVLAGSAQARFTPRLAPKVLHSFPASPSDGQMPEGAPVMDAAGNIFGITETGGAVGLGTAYELSPPAAGQTAWTETLLWNFGAITGDAVNPESDLVLGANGVLYGVTANGGAYGAGAVFALTPPAAGASDWTESVIFSFDPDNGTGASPNGKLLIDAAGDLYGAAYGGYENVSGLIFKLKPPATGTQWTEQILFPFLSYKPGGGAGPAAGVVADSAGNLYGTTKYGGVFPGNGYGTVYELSPPSTGHGLWTETVLYTFDGTKSGGYPVAGLAIGPNGVLYGTASTGGSYNAGTAFLVAPPAAQGGPWRFSLMHSFTNGTDGGDPTYALTLAANGEVFRTTNPCNKSVCGSVFELTRPATLSGNWTLTTLAGSPIGGYLLNPTSALTIASGHRLFGSASGGPAGGIAYKLQER